MTRKKPSLQQADASQNKPPNSPNIDAANASPSEGTEPVDQVDNTALIDEAVAAGRLLIEQGKPKIDAAMLIYEKLEQLPQETVVKAFIDGATLTTKGALTYWYNCRRKLKKMRLTAV